jgi:uncharacterized Zn finger protein
MSEGKAVGYCPLCGDDSVYRLGSTKEGEPVYECNECGSLFIAKKIEKYRIVVEEEEEKK